MTVKFVKTRSVSYPDQPRVAWRAFMYMIASSIPLLKTYAAAKAHWGVIFS